MNITSTGLKLMLEVAMPFGQGRVIQPRDRSYFMPNPAWLEYFGDWLVKNPPFETQPESADCDDFVTWARHEATLSLLTNPAIAKGRGLALFAARILFRVGGELNGIRALPGQRAHETLLCYCDDEEFYWLEPQTGKVTKHDEDALSSHIADYTLVQP